jgi:uncharacterized delta-60 repeat protein/uncharacterized repeat protein (TIGR01451 family)
MEARRLAGLTAAALLAMPAAALAAPASPDPGFGSGGVAQPAFPGAVPSAVGMELDAAGRAVIAARTGPMQAGLMRLAPGGAPEFAKVDSLGAGADARLTEVALQPTGGYVTGGWLRTAGGDSHFALARYSPAGDLLGVTSDSPAGDDEIGALAIAPDGRIVAAGRSGGGIGVARYSATGLYDGLFEQVHNFTGVSAADAGGVAFAPGGRIMVAGTGVVAGERRFLLAALTPAGGLDAGFGNGGLVTLDVGDGDATVRSLVVQPDGKLLVAGTTDAGGDGGGVIARFLPDGTPDAGFSTDGIARLGIPGGIVEDVALQADGKIVAAGSVDTGSPTAADSVIARFRPGGAHDPGFGDDGIARRSLGGAAADRLTGVGLAPGGAIVAAGLESSGTPGVVATRVAGGDSSDPALAMTAEALGDLVTFTVTATNRGADPAQGVRVTVSPPGNVAALALTTASSACAGSVCDLGTLPPGSLRRVTVLARAKAPGNLSASATISSATFDADAGNNRAGATGTATRNRVVRRDRTKPRVRLRLRARTIEQVRRRVPIAIRTSEAASVVVRTKWVADSTARAFARTRTVKLRRKGTKRVALALTRAGKAAVKRNQTRSLTLKFTVKARDKAGNKRVKSFTRTLRRARPKD